jgi:hypothetical protein
VLPLPLSGEAGRAVAVASRTEPRVARKTKNGETFMLFFGLGRKAACLGESLYESKDWGAFISDGESWTKS